MVRNGMTKYLLLIKAGEEKIFFYEIKNENILVTNLKKRKRFGIRKFVRGNFGVRGSNPSSINLRSLYLFFTFLASNDFVEVQVGWVRLKPGHKVRVQFPLLL